MHYCRSWYRKLGPIFLAVFIAAAVVSGAETKSIMEEASKALDAQDYTRARHLLERVCKEGVAVGCHYLGVLMNTGDGGPRDQTRARALFDQACKGRFAKSCFNLGLMFSSGEGGAQDKARARALYEQTCKGGHAESCSRLGNMLAKSEGGPRDESRARELFGQACRGGYAEGCFNQGVTFAKGLGGPKDEARARTLYSQACKQGYAAGCEIAALDKDIKKLEAEKERLDNWSKQYDELDRLEKQNAKYASQLKRAEEELKKAQEEQRIIEQAQKKNDEEIRKVEEKQRALDREKEKLAAERKQLEQDSRQEVEKTRTEWEKGCKGGNADDCYRLGFSMYDRAAAPRDKARANELFKQGHALLDRACKQGDARPCVQARADIEKTCKYRKFKRRYDAPCSVLDKPATARRAGPNPLAVPVDPERGRALFINGLDAFTARDYPRARSFYEQACQAGSATGCEYFALMLLGGTGGPQDTAGARELFDRTCKQGHVDSCVRLANMRKGGADIPPGTQSGRGGTHKPVPDSASAEVKSTPSVVSRPQSAPAPTPAAPPAVRAPRPSTGEAAQGSPNPLALLPDSTQTHHRRCTLDKIAGTYQTVYGPLVCKPGNGGLDCCYGTRCEKKAKLTLDESGQNMAGAWSYPDGKHGQLTFPISSQCALQSGRWGDAGQNPNRPWTVGRRR